MKRDLFGKRPRCLLGVMVLGAAGLGCTRGDAPGRAGPATAGSSGSVSRPTAVLSAASGGVGAGASGAASGHARSEHPALGGETAEYWLTQFARLNEGPMFVGEAPPEAWGRRVRFRGTLFDKGSELGLCGEQRGRPPTKLKVDGLDWSKVRWAKRNREGREAPLEIDGVLERERLVVEAVRRPPPLPVRERQPELPCPAPTLAERVRDATRVSEQHQQAAMEYAEKQPDMVSSRLHWLIPMERLKQRGDYSFRAEDGVLAFSFTGELDRHRAELEARWGGAVCVGRGNIPAPVQRAISNRATVLLRQHGLQHGQLSCAFGLSFDSAREALELRCVAWDPERLSRWLSTELAGLPVEVESPITPL